MRFFNTTGPCDPSSHYMLPAVPRLPEARRYIAHKQYFVVHAPRQTGKTTTLAALARELTAEGDYLALWFSCEHAGPAGDDYGAVGTELLTAMRRAAAGLDEELQPPDPWPVTSPGSLLIDGLSAWAAKCPRPLVLFLDEIDALHGVGMLSVLRQLRAGYTSRPAPFPASVVLCGMRNVRDYKAASGGNPDRLVSASPFNIKVRSIRLGDFTAEEVAGLYEQHTEETGQKFTQEAIERAFIYTSGQPWLVNALASEITEEMGVVPPETITAEHVDRAKERLILARATHLDSLAAKLHEPRVRRVMEPLIAGRFPETTGTYNDDASYVRDLGLISLARIPEVANPIYREVIVRGLGEFTEARILAEPRSFVRDDGTLNFGKLLEEFTVFWKEHGEVLTTGAIYREAAAQLVMMAFLQRIVNGGGMIDREYGVGRDRVDLQVRWPYATEGQRVWQREAIELKVWRTAQTDPLDEGLRQLDDYLDRLNLTHGTLVVFDERPEAAPITERTHLSQTSTPVGRAVTLLRA